MREIKFRSWVKAPSGNTWMNESPIFHGEINEIFTGEGSLGEIIYMQFTGLKDKNGVEIFEGDIVEGYYDEWDQYFEETNRHQFLSDVKYIDNSFKVHRNTVNDEGRIRDYGYLHEWDNESIEVIGNIYENPELLSKHDTSETP